MLSSGCAGMANSDAPPATVVCGSVYAYSRPERIAAADALAALGRGHALRRMIENHGAQQAENRACKAVQARRGGR
jgi:hypothetical protein